MLKFIVLGRILIYRNWSITLVGLVPFYSTKATTTTIFIHTIQIQKKVRQKRIYRKRNERDYIIIYMYDLSQCADRGFCKSEW